MAVERTPEGYLRIPAAIARHGMYDYYAAELRSWGVPLEDHIPDEAILKVYRDAKEVFDKSSMESFANKPLTRNHPGELVSPDTVKRDMIGMSLSPVRALPNGDDIGVDVQIMSRDGIRDYENGVRELSAGYQSTLVMDSGRAPDGQPYDMRQTQIIGNHIALVKRGRAGSARLLDSNKENNMSEPRVDAVEHGKVKQQLADAEAQITALKKSNDELQGKLDALEKAAVSDEEIQKKIDDGVKESLENIKQRAATMDRAKLFAPELKDDGAMSLKDIMSEAIKAKNPDIDLKDRSEDYVRGVFENLPKPNGSGTKTKYTDSGGGSANYSEALTFDELRGLPLHML